MASNGMWYELNALALRREAGQLTGHVSLVSPCFSEYIWQTLKVYSYLVEHKCYCFLTRHGWIRTSSVHGVCLLGNLSMTFGLHSQSLSQQCLISTVLIDRSDYKNKSFNLLALTKQRVIWSAISYYIKRKRRRRRKRRRKNRRRRRYNLYRS